jgi:hypothetical protein
MKKYVLSNDLRKKILNTLLFIILGNVFAIRFLSVIFYERHISRFSRNLFFGIPYVSILYNRLFLNPVFFVFQ